MVNSREQLSTAWHSIERSTAKHTNTEYSTSVVKLNTSTFKFKESYVTTNPLQRSYHHHHQQQQLTHSAMHLPTLSSALAIIT